MAEVAYLRKRKSSDPFSELDDEDYDEEERARPVYVPLCH